MSSTPDKSQKRHPPDYDKGLPESDQAEKMVLGSIMLGAIGADAVAQSLQLDDFSTDRHRCIFRAMLELHQQGISIDRVTLAEELKRRRQFSGIGGFSYITSLDDGMPQLAHPGAYVEIVKDKAIQRAGITVAHAIATRFLNGDESSNEVLTSAVTALQTLQSRNGHQQTETTAPQWPEPIAEAGFHGIAGELVRLIEPHTEADSTALLFQFLTAWGSLAGRGPYYLAEADRHHTNEYVVLVGTTSKGRKGTSWGRIRGVLHGIDEHWVDECLHPGLGSGEALIATFGEEKDKRACIIESEFARLLAIINREGSTISANVRNGWDTGTLSIETRQNKVKVKGAHLSLIGHITREELLRRLADTEAANGFGNRILWACVTRSKVLPFGGGSTDDAADIIRKLKAATDHARRVGNTRIDFDDHARQLWAAVYPDLSEGKPGLVGHMTSRAEAHVVRLSLIYAMLDCATGIRVEHLRAALAVWRYCDASAAFIWGTALGDPAADEILRALRGAPDGLTRWDLMNHFSRNKSATELDRAIGVLAERGLIRSEKEESGGRPSIRYKTA